MSDDVIEIDLTRRQFVAVTGSLAATGSLAGCLGQDGGGNDGTVRVTVGLNSDVWNLDPALWTDESSSTVGSLLFDEVIELTTDDTYEPGLVEEVPDLNPDGPHYDYTLREGLTFHNGDPVTAEDFKYSVDWILNPDNNSPIQSRLPFVKGTEIIDDRSLRLNMEKPFATLNGWLTRGIEGIVPDGSRGDVREGKGPSGYATDLTKDPSGIGTGAFKFVEWESGSHVLLEKNEEYWKENAPRIDEIQFDVVPEDATRLADIRSGNIDLINKVPPKDFEGLKGNANMAAESVPGSLTQVLYVNLMEAEGNPMGNVHNRRAVLFGIDAKEILDEIFYSQGVVQKGPWYPDSEWTSPKLKEMKLYDPEKATAELEKAGNPDGFEMEIMATKGSWFKDEAVIIQNQLSNIGIDVSVTALEKSTVFNKVYGTTDWHAVMEDWAQSIPVATFWLDAGFADNNHNHNNWHHAADDLQDPYEPSGPPAPADAEGDYSNGHEWFVAKLQETQTMTDEQQQKESVWRLEEYIVENALQIDIAYINTLEAWRNAIENYDFGTFVDEFRFVEKGD